MYKTSTYFVKGQYPKLTKYDLLARYERELEEQSVDNIIIDNDTINFSNNILRFVINRFADKYSSFSSGQIEIFDDNENNELGIYLQANLSRLFISAGIKSVIAFLFFSFGLGFNLITLYLGIGIFILLCLIGFIITAISFPIYFTNFRNDIERELQNDEK